MKLILLRHGQSLWNLENRFTGWRDVELSEAGMAEARMAAFQLKNIQVDLAFTSKLSRAQHTLQIIRETNGWVDLPILMDVALNERRYGELEGLNKADTALKYGEQQVQLWRRAFADAPPKGESLQDTYNRVIPYFKSFILPQLQKSMNVLVVAHGNSLRALIMYLENLTPDCIVKREIPTAVPSVYDFSYDQLRNFSGKD
ncbi:2,3-bisphosphoglycerate-dependent phosphoglycerate mutase [Sphingobacterium sp. Mn56C]|uniref:2,3-bisphosphoglycerate-dependent phosphoglycerate mutase n=1 Tax=Sphingobacterium sp. Mn56C TaxID=3395261 RepID=UPI003BE1BB59